MSRGLGSDLAPVWGTIVITNKTNNFVVIERDKHYLVLVNIYESLFSPYVRATLVVNDKDDIIKNMKIKGDDEVVMYFNSVSSEEPQYYILSINSIINESKRTDSRTNLLYFDCVCISYRDFYKRLSKRYVGDSSFILNDILTNNVLMNLPSIYDGYDQFKLNFTQGNGELDLQTNNKSVLDFIQLVCKIDNKFFYQDAGGFHTKSLEDMIGVEKKGDIYFPVDQTKWKYQNVAKSYTFEHFNNELLLDKNVIYPHYINLEPNHYVINQHEQTFSDIGNSDFFEHLQKNRSTQYVTGNIENKMNKVISQFNLNSNLIKVKMNGNEKRRIGDKYYLDFKGNSNLNELHELYTGNWIITDIKHELTMETYIQDISFAKVNYSI